MAICRKKNTSVALDEVQDETFGFRKRIAGRFADRRQMNMAEAAFTPAMLARFNVDLATVQPSKRDVAAVRKKVADVPPRPAHAARGKLLATGDFACDSTDQPRWAAEAAAREWTVAA